MNGKAGKLIKITATITIGLLLTAYITSWQFRMFVFHHEVGTFDGKVRNDIYYLCGIPIKGSVELSYQTCEKCACKRTGLFGETFTYTQNQAGTPWQIWETKSKTWFQSIITLIPNYEETSLIKYWGSN